MWSWCCQLNYYSEEKVNKYLKAISKLERDNPRVTYVYMTGNAQALDGHHTYKGNNKGYNRYLRNEQIRNYCKKNSKVLFDFADIESWFKGIKATTYYNKKIFPREHDQFNHNESWHTSRKIV